MSAKLIQDIQQAAVTPDMLMKLQAAVRSEEVGPDFDPTWLTFKVFKDDGLSSHALLATLYRMEALCRLMVCGKLKRWEMGATCPDGAALIHNAVFAAAASCKLNIPARRGRLASFDVEEFNSLALAAADVEGRA